MHARLIGQRPILCPGTPLVGIQSQGFYLSIGAERPMNSPAQKARACEGLFRGSRSSSNSNIIGALDLFIEQLTLALGGCHPIAFLDKLSHVFPIQINIKPYANPPMLANIGRNKKAFLIRTDQEGL